MAHPNDLTLAYSTCPNDTFLFHALVHGHVPCGDLRFKVTLEDVETLNQRAGQGVYDISKLSFAALGNLLENYGLLRTGSALGRGCGPLLITRPGTDLSKLGQKPIAVPGLQTTANLLLGLYLDKKSAVTPMVFDQIMPAVVRGEYDFGVIIHEGRFTYESHGLSLVQDLGAWWEEETGLPIPLGGIAVKRKLPQDTIRGIELAIAQSTTFGFDHRQASRSYIKAHAKELSEDVIRQHIDLYVNRFTVNLGDEGEQAVLQFFELARQKGLLPSFSGSLFAC